MTPHNDPASAHTASQIREMLAEDMGSFIEGETDQLMFPEMHMKLLDQELTNFVLKP